jgi:transcriptional regulator with XRE-family HTH domain
MQILILMNILSTFVEKKKSMEDVLAINVKRICKEKGLLMKELAAKLNITPESLTRAIKGQTQLSTIRNIAAALNVSVAELVKEKESTSQVLRGYVEIGRNNIYHFDSLAKLRNILHREGIDLG